MAGYNLGEARGKIILETDFKSLDEAQKAIGGFQKSAGQSATSAQEAWSKTGTAATVGGGLVAAAFGVAVKSATDFEFQMSAVQAVSGATAQEMDLIRAAALRIGADTSFSASEAALAMEELVKAGISTEDVLNGAADATVALAAAGGVDLPTAATIAANAMNQFQLGAQDLVGVTDLIAGAANASAIDVGQFGYSLSQVGAVANLAGLNFNDTATAIAAMGNAGIVGSDAGTSLKSMLMNLQPTTKEQTNLMKELGLVTEEGANQFYTAEGSLKSLAEISDVLGGALQGMTDAQKQATLEVLFGADAIRGAAVIAEQGSAGINALNDAMLATSAADVAATRMDNMKGSTEALMGSLETLMINIGSMLIPRLREIVDRVNEVVNWFSSLDASTQQTIVQIASLASGFLLGVGAIIKVTQALMTARGVILAVTGATGLLAAAKNAEGAAQGRSLAGIVANTAALAAQRAASIASATAAGVVAAATRAAATAQAVYTGAVKSAAVAAWLMKPANAAAAASMVAMKVAQLAGAAATGVATAAQWAWNAALTANPIGIIIVAVAALVAALIWFFTQTELGQQIVQNVTRFIQEAWANVMAFLEPVFKWIGEAAVNIWNGIQTAVAAVVSWFQSYVLPVIQTVIQMIIAYWNMYWTVISTVWNAIMTVVGAVVAWFQTHVYPAIEAIVNFLVALFTYLGKWVEFIWNTIMAAIGMVIDWIVSYVVAQITAFVGFWTGLWQTVSDIITAVWNAIVSFLGPIVDGIVSFITNLWQQFSSFISGVMSAIGSIISSTWNTIQSVISAVMNAVWGVIQSIWNQIRGFIEPVVSGVVSFISNTWSTIAGTVQGIFNNVYNAIKGPLDNAINFIAGIKDRIIGFFAGAGSWLVNAGRSIIEGFLRGLESMLSNITGFFNNLTNMIPEVKGPPEKDRKLLTPAGHMIMQSLMNGLDDETKNLYGMLNSLNATIPATLQQTVLADVNGGKGMRPVQINVEWHSGVSNDKSTKQEVIEMLGHATELVREELD